MNQPDEMDLTLYLQTEGRRLAAELARQQPTGSSKTRPSCAQQQCTAAQPARSLSEALQHMGLAGAHPRHRRL
ncbi:hypothetical protein PMI15_01231 [Polaromonas sp. CF318]|uniref:hypothetical protein n=1 Tax=Polaromonas sp. CF318 TaxID=1144318 RepID=UPI000270DB09|nr:hypothetical protein [Polaromonas sp. CF318]EJL87085.1 hypothetical protein PMI15_01231 [Polaromonas sp. CF318]